MTRHQRRKYLIGWEKLKMWLADFTSFYSEKLRGAASIKDTWLFIYLWQWFNSVLWFWSAEISQTSCRYSFHRVRPDLLKFKPAERLCFILQTCPHGSHRLQTCRQLKWHIYWRNIWLNVWAYFCQTKDVTYSSFILNFKNRISYFLIVLFHSSIFFCLSSSNFSWKTPRCPQASRDI